MAIKKKSSSNSISKKKTKVTPPVKVAAAEIPASTKNGAFVSLRDLAKRCGLSQHAARVRLNKANVKRPGTRWRFAAGSSQLVKAMKVLQETYFS